MEFSNITSKLGEDLNMWQKLLLDIKYVVLEYCCDDVYMYVHIRPIILMIAISMTNICAYYYYYYYYYYYCVFLIRKSRRTIDTTETMRKFGPVEIHYGKVSIINILTSAVMTILSVLLSDPIGLRITMSWPCLSTNPCTLMI